MPVLQGRLPEVGIVLTGGFSESELRDAGAVEVVEAIPDVRGHVQALAARTA